MRRSAWAPLILLAVAPLAEAQVRAGGEFRVNATTTGFQEIAAVGRDSRGNFVVVWSLDNVTSIVGQRFDRAGLPQGSEFVVDNATLPVQEPAVAMNARGEFLVAWMQFDQVTWFDIRGQVYDPSGLRIGAEFRVNDFTPDDQLVPTVAADGRGDFLVAWWSHYQDGSYDYAAVARKISRQGVPLGTDLMASTYITGNQWFTDVGADAAGNFVVAWAQSPYPVPDPPDPSQYQVFAQRFDSGGVPQGANIHVNTGVVFQLPTPAVRMAPDGSFVVAYTRTLSDSDIAVQRFSATGGRLGAQLIANTFTTGRQVFPHLDMDAQGNFVVAWNDLDGADGNYYGVRARRFRANGTPRGDEFAVNTSTTGNQTIDPVAAGVASDEVGNFVVAWWNSIGANPMDVFAQRFGGLHPAALTVDGAGNGVWEPGETVDVRPAWANANGAAQTIGGGLSALGGPAGPTYSITDGVAVYPTIADGASARCADCYTVSVSAPGPRPALHWDAAAVEMLTPDAQGQAKKWTLHVGGSFADVPGASPFYRFVETLLHQGVTAGCSGTQYCPASATPREQMAVFVLVAREGAGFVPPACTTPVFGDVPAASPFCRYVEELVRRGVVNGCGGGNYCPNDAVTREQMAVFLLRTLEPALSPPACTTPMFGDVPPSSPFCRWVEELARRGITAGCGGGNYCPTQPVTREQMAVFLTTTFGLTLYGP